MAYTMPSGSAPGFIFTIDIPINDDNRVENIEQFNVTLSSVDPDIIIDAGTEEEIIYIIDNDCEKLSLLFSSCSRIYNCITFFSLYAIVGLFGWRDSINVFQETDGNVSLFVQLLNDVVLDRELEVQYSCTDSSATGM